MCSRKQRKFEKKNENIGQRYENRRPYPMHKTPTFVGSGRGHNRQPHPQFLGEAAYRT